MAIYTKNGDNGTTSLQGGYYIHKSHERIEFIGVLDELNAHLGLLINLMESTQFHGKKHLIVLIKTIQSRFFDIGSELTNLNLPIKEQCDFSTITQKIEKIIDQLELKLPVLRNFIIPGGSKLSCLAHISRTVTRRAERSFFRLVNAHPPALVSLNRSVGKLLNRFSDFLFVLARYFNHIQKHSDQLWKNSNKKSKKTKIKMMIKILKIRRKTLLFN